MVLRDEKGRKMVAGKWWQENGGRKMKGAGKWEGRTPFLIRSDPLAGASCLYCAS
jgi:hypothetical protein